MKYLALHAHNTAGYIMKLSIPEKCKSDENAMPKTLHDNIMIGW